MHWALPPSLRSCIELRAQGSLHCRNTGKATLRFATTSGDTGPEFELRHSASPLPMPCARLSGPSVFVIDCMVCTRHVRFRAPETVDVTHQDLKSRWFGPRKHEQVEMVHVTYVLLLCDALDSNIRDVSFVCTLDALISNLLSTVAWIV